MKKFTKVAIVMVLVFGIFGAVLLGAGVAAGASTEDLTAGWEKNRVFRMLGIGGGYDARTESVEAWAEEFEEDVAEEAENQAETWAVQQEASEDSYPEVTRESTTTIAADRVKKLDVEIMAGDAEIRFSPGNDIKISGLYEYDEIYFDDSDELCICRYESTGDSMVIELPENKRFEEISLYVDGGNIQVTGQMTAEECDLDTYSGNLTVDLIACREADLECYSGNLETKFTGKLEDYEMEMECYDGNLFINGTTYTGTQEGKFGSHHSSPGAVRNVHRKIDAEMQDGNLKIEFEQ